MPHSGLKPKNEKDPKEEDDFGWKMTFDGRRSLTEDDLDDDLWRKTTFDSVYSILPEINVYNSSP